MPNHVINEVVFTGVDKALQSSILLKMVSPESKIDFEVLLPPPLNIWQGNVGAVEEGAFPGNQLDWNRKNWGTKWNAYGMDEIDDKYAPIVSTENTLVLTFQTAWNPPRGWLVALFNTINLSFEHNFLSEDDDGGHTEYYIYNKEDKYSSKLWKYEKATKEMYKHLHKLLFGCEEFEPEET